MSSGQSFTLYTYTLVDEGRADRWAYTGVQGVFFFDEESARQQVFELRRDVESEPENKWSPIQLEKIESLPISKETIFALLNDGMGTFVKSHEIVDIID
ncbi:hypothetical protein ACU8V1_25845 (plasmid) [Rhizobium leguminosarum]